MVFFSKFWIIKLDTYLLKLLLSMHSLSSKLLYLSLAIIMLFIAGCADDLRNRTLFDCGAGDAVIRYSVEDVILTRDGESQNFESVVDHAYLLFYEFDASLETDTPVAAVKAEVDPAVAGNLKFKMPLSLTPNTDYKLLAVANADNYVPDGYHNFGEYLEHWCKNTTDRISNPLLVSKSSCITPDIGSLPMNGGLTGDSKFRFTIDNGAYNISASLSLRRLVARIDVSNNLSNFKIESVALCNWRDAVPAAVSTDQIGNSFGAVQGALTDEGATINMDSFVSMPNSGENGIQQLNKQIYCFPSISYDSSLGDNESTALIIKAKYGEDTDPTYYRVNVGMTGNVSKVKANTKYSVVIQSVKGSGATSPEEAYRSTESLVMLSVVEDWDLEGNAYAMDDYGNFIVLSKGSLEFEGNSTDNVEVRVLTSKGLNWTAEYLADNDAASSAFVVTRHSDMAVAICPKGKNESELPLTGKCRVSAVTSQGDTLAVDISLSQLVAEGKPSEPVIPSEMPFALVPESYERVKIDHENKTIEIDGFDPSCFNSFIDIPFQVYVNESYNTALSLSVETTLAWPLEGGISKTAHDDYYYCSNSFATEGTNIDMIYSNTKKKELNIIDALGSSKSFNVSKNETFHILIGAMAPDDPAINKTITLKNSEDFKNVVYNLQIKPRPAIIDDVILEDNGGKHWIVMDRNLQDASKYNDYIGRLSDGKKRQAYNFLSLGYKIPYKYSNAQNETPFNEAFHVLYRGLEKIYSERSNLLLNNQTSAGYTWLTSYVYQNGQVRNSPFYESSNIDNWEFPRKELLELCASKMHVSKMRMYLVSEVPFKSGRTKIPICCYWPFQGYFANDTSNDTRGYYIANDSGSLSSMMLIYYDDVEIKTFTPSSLSSYTGLSRLVRPLTQRELDEYKNANLGYGSTSTVPNLCHPDTYTSEGWLDK